MACTPRAIREVKGVVAQADSLWHAGQMYGVDAGDSATLAQAYETLGAIPLPFREGLGLGSSYARSCYYYGRLLRAKEDPVSAMQVFINATHSHTRDYHILGRVYSNMGDIAHLANEFELSYDMYKRSGDMYLKNGDTLLYYYDLNNMAFELAEQGRKEEAVTLLTSVSNKCTDKGVRTKLLETTAEMYCKVQQYDSAIFYVNQLVDLGYNLPSGMLIKAQAFSYLAEKDSALYYAREVADISNSINDIYNALYILSYDDTTLVGDEILRLASQRDDLHTYKIDVQKTEHSKAVQILEQDLHNELNLTWLYAIIATIFIIGTFIGIYVYRKRIQHKLLSQEVEDLLNKNEAAIQQHEQILQEHTEYTNNLIAQIEANCTILHHAEDFPNNIYWKDFDAMSKLINDNFGMLVTKLQNTHQLSEKEIRLCILVLIGNLSGKQLADLLCYADSGIRNFKNRIANKLGTNSVELRDILINLAIN